MHVHSIPAIHSLILDKETNCVNTNSLNLFALANLQQLAHLKAQHSDQLIGATSLVQAGSNLSQRCRLELHDDGKVKLSMVYLL